MAEKMCRATHIKVGLASKKRLYSLRGDYRAASARSRPAGGYCRRILQMIGFFYYAASCTPARRGVAEIPGF